MSLDLVVLGCSGTHPGPGRVCSGYLLRSERTSVLVDCGYGSTANLQRVAAVEDVDAVVVSHRHPDHCVDLVGLYYALRFHPGGERSIDVHAPAGTGPYLQQLLSGDTAEDFAARCRFHDVAPGDTLEVGDIALSFFASRHTVPTVSVRAQLDGRVVAYSADSAGGPELVAAARDADLFVCEASWVGEPDGYPDGVHLTARGAGEVASAAGVGRLVLTHLYPTNDRDRTLEEASAAFAGRVELAEDLAEHEVAP